MCCFRALYRDSSTHRRSSVNSLPSSLSSTPSGVSLVPSTSNTTTQVLVFFSVCVWPSRSCCVSSSFFPLLLLSLLSLSSCYCSYPAFSFYTSSSSFSFWTFSLLLLFSSLVVNIYQFNGFLRSKSSHLFFSFPAESSFCVLFVTIFVSFRF